MGIARSGEEAIAMSQKNGYDIAFIDMKLPAISGLEASLADDIIGLNFPIIPTYGMDRHYMERGQGRAVHHGPPLVARPYSILNSPRVLFEGQTGLIGESTKEPCHGVGDMLRGSTISWKSPHTAHIPATSPLPRLANDMGNGVGR